jgi:hypothetical protein
MDGTYVLHVQHGAMYMLCLSTMHTACYQGDQLLRTHSMQFLACMQLACLFGYARAICCLMYHVSAVLRMRGGSSKHVFV